MPQLSHDDVRDFLAAHRNGVLATLRAGGRPQLSNVFYGLLDGRIQISVTETRSKTANLRRDPRVSLHVTSEDFWTYLVVEGTAELGAVAREPGDASCQELLRHYESLAGPHPDHGEFFAAQVAERRLLLSFEVEHLYPVR
jgi:PPOX class probable F420-dependent enzyme